MLCKLFNLRTLKLAALAAGLTVLAALIGQCSMSSASAVSVEMFAPEGRSSTIHVTVLNLEQ